MGEPDVTKIYNNLPDNSHKAKQERANAPAPVVANANGKRVEKVVRGKVKTRKNDVRKLTDIFITDDVANVKDHILFDVIAPAVKKALYDSVVNSLDMMLFGGRGGTKRSTADKISYRDYNSVSRRDERSYGRDRDSRPMSYDDLVFDTRADADAVLSRMDEIIEEYNQVRVADMFELAGRTGEYTDNKYGWTNIRSAKIISVRDGYIIDMPRATRL